MDWRERRFDGLPCACVGLLVVLCIGLAGCGGGATQLMSTPNIYATGERDPFPDVPASLQNNHAEVLYVTDRAYDTDSKPGAPKYGHKRSRSVVFGVADVQFGKDVSWEQLVKASTSAKREVKLEVTVDKVTELFRFPATPRTLVELPSAAAAAATQPTTEPFVDEEIHQALNE